MDFGQTVNESALLDLLRSGSRADDAIRVIYKEYYGSLSWFILNNGGNTEDAEDIFQEVVVSFIDLVRKQKFRGESSIKTFLFSMNRNLWLNELKRKGRSRQRELKYEMGTEKIQEDAAHQLANREEKESLMKLVEELGETCKKILVSFYFHNLPMREILEQLEYENEQVVRNKKYKCLKKLEEMINRHPSIKQTLKNLLNG